MIASNGWLDVLLYATTRADIVFAIYPLLEDIGLDTFAVMEHGCGFGTATTVESEQGGSSRLARGRRMLTGDSVENLYALDAIMAEGEVTVCADGKLRVAMYCKKRRSVIVSGERAERIPRPEGRHYPGALRC